MPARTQHCLGCAPNPLLRSRCTAIVHGCCGAIVHGCCGVAALRWNHVSVCVCLHGSGLLDRMRQSPNKGTVDEVSWIFPAQIWLRGKDARSAEADTLWGFLWECIFFKWAWLFLGLSWLKGRAFSWGLGWESVAAVICCRHCFPSFVANIWHCPSKNNGTKTSYFIFDVNMFFWNSSLVKFWGLGVAPSVTGKGGVLARATANIVAGSSHLCCHHGRPLGRLAG